MNSPWMARRSPLWLLAAALLVAFAIAGASAARAVAAAPYLYWTSSNDTVGRVEVDGGNPEPGFVTGADGPKGPSVTGTHLYWAETGTDSVARVTRDGTIPQLDLVTGATDVDATAVDAGYVYWDSQIPWGTLGRAELDGSDATNNWYGGPADVTSLARLGDRLFFASDGDRIGYLSESSGHSHLVTGIAPQEIAATNRYLYWTDPAAGAIGRANLDGSGVDNRFIEDLGEPTGITTDGTHLYWGDRATDTIGRANLDGSAVRADWIDSIADPTGLAISVPVLSASTDSFAFGDQAVGSIGAPQRVTFQNRGENVLLPSGVRTANRQWWAENASDFLVSYDGCTGIALAPGARCTVEARFAPSATGARSAELHLTSNALPQSPAVVALTGTGVTPPPPERGEQGPIGPHGEHGERGEPGVRGEQGTIGPAGSAGAQGPQGAAGSVLVRCAIVRARARRAAARTRCTVAVVNGTGSARVQARLASTRGKVVARANGKLRRGRGTLTLTSGRKLGAGRYLLTVASGGERTTRSITLR